MSILNLLLTREHLVVAVDTLAEDAFTGAHSAGAKLLLIPQHNLVFATRGSTQFFLRIYELALQASYRADFTMERRWIARSHGPATEASVASELVTPLHGAR